MAPCKRSLSQSLVSCRGVSRLAADAEPSKATTHTMEMIKKREREVRKPEADRSGERRGKGVEAEISPSLPPSLLRNVCAFLPCWFFLSPIFFF